MRAAWDESEARGLEVETQLGIQFCHGLSVNFTARAAVVRVPESICWDAQLTIWASGGVAQYEANQFLHTVTTGGVGMRQIDDLVAQTQHARRRRFKRSLGERMVPGEGSHLRAFADETIAIVATLTIFCDMILEPVALLPHHATCMRLLFTIQCIVLMGDYALPHLQFLDELLESHHLFFWSSIQSAPKTKAASYATLGEAVAAISQGS